MSNQGNGLNTGLEPGSEPIFVIAFIGMIVLMLIYITYLFLFSSKRKFTKPFFLTSASLLLYIPAFYFYFGVLHTILDLEPHMKRDQQTLE